jgi:small subunit ribosomal protein S17
METTTKSKRVFEGIVTSDKMSKTIVVRVDSTKLHERYGKRFVVSTKFKVHDEAGKAHTGDVVTFVECRPLSRDKRWTLSEIVKVAPKSIVVADDTAEVLKTKAE